MKPPLLKIPLIQEQLLNWFDQHQRRLPWRAKNPNPYHVLLSEVMLQQTTVATVISYFEKFVVQYPTIFDLANAQEDQLMSLWQGLGYYARARNLHKCAKVLVSDYGGCTPKDYATLLSLPGIGSYTAAAIASIAFKKPIIAIDTNVNRVLSRLFAINTSPAHTKKAVEKIAQFLVHPNRSGCITQSLMDIGATFCKSSNPSCALCPLQKSCSAYTHNMQNLLPKKTLKKKPPDRYSHCYVIGNKNYVYIEKRKSIGLLANLYQFPCEEFMANKQEPQFPIKGKWVNKGTVIHIFSHFKLHLTVWQVSGEARIRNALKVQWQDLPNYGMATLFKKVIKKTYTS